MANIDTSTINGFDAMSDAEKVTALLALEIPEAVDLTGYVKKDVFDAKSSEAARLARELREKTTEADTASASLSTAQSELAALKQAAYIAGKGIFGEQAEFITFKAAKMVDDKTTFEQAVDALTKETKPAFDWQGGIGSGAGKPDGENAQMNALIRGAFK